MMKTGLGENEDEEKEVRNLGDCSLSSSFRVHRKAKKIARPAEKERTGRKKKMKTDREETAGRVRPHQTVGSGGEVSYEPQAERGVVRISVC